MKQLKFLMVAVTLLMGISLTSCLNSGNNENAYDGGGYVRTEHGYMGTSYFVDLEGNKYIPTESSLATLKANTGFDMSTADLVLIYFKNVETATTKESATTTSKSIHLVSAEAVDSYKFSTEATSVVENAPIITLNPTDGYGNAYKPGLYGAEMILLPVFWKMENKVETLKQHKFSLVPATDEIETSSTELVFYLRHNKGTDTKTETNAFSLKAYDIKSLMTNFKNKTTRYPAKIVIKAKAATDGATMPETYTDYELDSSYLNK